MRTGPSHDHFLADILNNRCNRAILEAWNALELPDGEAPEAGFRLAGEGCIPSAGSSRPRVYP